MCYITRDLLAADLSLRLPLYIFSPRFSLRSPRLTGSLIFRQKVKHRSARAKHKDRGPDMWRHYTFGVSSIVTVYHPDTCSRWADRARSCITKAESGLMRVREVQMCWMGFISANKPHLYLVLFLDSVHLSSFLSLSLLIIHLYWPDILIPITRLPSRNYHYSLLKFVFPFCVVCSKQFTDSFILGWFMNGWGQLCVSCGLFIASHWSLLSIYSSPKIHSNTNKTWTVSTSWKKSNRL